jgi:hypothetical protein
MAKKQLQPNLSLLLTRVTRTIYFFAFFFGLSIVIFDSGNLITREAVIQRWTLLTALLVINAIAWIVAATVARKSLKTLGIVLLSFSIVVFAGCITYWERGMASTSTLFFVLPLLVVAILKNRHALLATATLSAATYAFAAVKYFNDFFNEGYRIQLWGNIVLYCGTIFVCTWLIMVITDIRKDSA